MRDKIIVGVGVMAIAAVVGLSTGWVMRNVVRSKQKEERSDDTPSSTSTTTDFAPEDREKLDNLIKEARVILTKMGEVSKKLDPKLPREDWDVLVEERHKLKTELHAKLAERSELADLMSDGVSFV